MKTNHVFIALVAFFAFIVMGAPVFLLIIGLAVSAAR